MARRNELCQVLTTPAYPKESEVEKMTHHDQETEVEPPAKEPEEMPLPSDPKTIFLGGLFVLSFLAAAYVASEIVLPFVFAFTQTGELVTDWLRS
jgi:hypothetical protein